MSIHICAKCGKQGDVKWSSHTSERVAEVASCDKDDCPATLAAKFFAGLIPVKSKEKP